MKIKRFFALMVATAAFTAATMTACSSDDDDPTIYTVTFHSNGGTTIDDQTVAHGDYATVPDPVPSKLDYAFSGWYTDDDTFLQAFNFSTPITTDIDLYAKWRGIDLDALVALVHEAAELNAESYTGDSWEDFEEALFAAQGLLHAENATDAQIIAAYNALARAMSALVPHLDQNPTIDFGSIAVNGFVYVAPGSYFHVYAYVSDGSAVTFEVDPPVWMENIVTDADYFSARISDTASINATAVIKARSVRYPSLSASFTLKVTPAATIKTMFLDAVNALPAPEEITYTDAPAVEAAQALLNTLPHEVYDGAVDAAIEKLWECQYALEALPERLKYTFSGNTATISYIDYSGAAVGGASFTLAYAKNGSFPCGIYTSTTWIDLGGEGYMQMRLTLNANGSYELSARYATNASGANASPWEIEETGTYTNQGSQSAAGGILTLSAAE